MTRFLLAFALCASSAFAAVHGTPWANTGSALGVNLAGVNPNTSEQPFLNVAKTGGGWFTLASGSVVQENSYLYTNCLDANGYPITLSTTVGSCNSGGHTFNQVSFLVMGQQTNYAGVWIFDYDNTGTFAINKDGSSYTSCPISGHPNRHLLTSSAVGNGIGVTLTATGSGNAYAQNIRMTYAPTSSCGNGTTASQDAREVSLYAGEIVNPDFKTAIGPFRTLRFLDWMDTVHPVGFNTVGVWANRPQQNWVFWDENTSNGAGTAPWTVQEGVPAEVMIAFCNELHADCWFNMPTTATDQYITNLATLAHDSLNGGLSVYSEWSDEPWNSATPVYSYVNTQAIATFNAGWNDGGYNWYGMQQARVGILWKAAWGADAGRVINPINIQNGTSTGSATDGGQLLSTPMWTGSGTFGGPSPGGPASAHFDAIATAPYLGYNPPPPWYTSADNGVGQTFQEINQGGLMPTGVGACTSTGTSTALAVSSHVGSCGTSGSVTCPPADQTILPITFSVTPGASPKLAVDGCATVIPLQQAYSGGLQDPSAASNGQTWNVSYAAAQGANGTWILTNLGFSGGMLAEANFYMSQWSTYASSNSMIYVAYESGPAFTSNALTTTMITNVNADPRMAAVESTYNQIWKANGGHIINQFNDIQPIDQTDGFYWGMLTSVIPASSAKYYGILDFIRRNPCWWTNCR